MAQRFSFYQVQQILGHRQKAGILAGNIGRLQYFIKWKGYGHHFNSWEPQQNVEGCEDVLDEYRSKMAVRTPTAVDLKSAQCHLKRRRKQTQQFNPFLRHKKKRQPQVIEIVSSDEEQKAPEQPTETPSVQQQEDLLPQFPQRRDLPEYQPEELHILQHLVRDGQLYFLVNENYLERTIPSSQLETTHTQKVLTYYRSMMLRQASKSQPPPAPSKIPDLPDFEQPSQPESEFELEYYIT